MFEKQSLHSNVSQYIHIFPSTLITLQKLEHKFQNFGYHRELMENFQKIYQIITAFKSILAFFRYWNETKVVIDIYQLHGGFLPLSQLT